MLNHTNTLFPPGILYRRIEISLKTFYDDLKTFSKTMNWKFDPYVNSSNGKTHKWKNNLVEVEQIEQYDDGRPKGYILTYYIPSPIGEPLDTSRPANLTDNIPLIGYKHKIYVSLPFNYPSVRSIESSVQRSDTLYIESRSQLFHPRFYLRQKSWGCVMVNGEIDRIAMNLFQQFITFHTRHDIIGNDYGNCKIIISKVIINVQGFFTWSSSFNYIIITKVAFEFPLETS